MIGIKESSKKLSFLDERAVQLDDIPSNKLEEFVKDFLKNDREKLELNMLQFCKLPHDSDVFIYLSTAQVLIKRHGWDYVCKLVGYEEPKNLNLIDKILNKMQGYLWKELLKQ